MFVLPKSVDHKIRCVAFKKHRFLGLTPDLLIRCQGVGPRNIYLKKAPSMGPSVLWPRKHHFEIIRCNSGSSWEEKQSWSQKLGGRVPELFTIQRDSQSQTHSLGSYSCTLEAAPNKMKGQHGLPETRCR